MSTSCPKAARPRGRRIAENFPKWKNWKLVESGAEVAPGVRILNYYGHTPGHSVFLVTSGKDQLMISNDTMYVPSPRASPGLAGRIRSRRTAGGHDPSSDHRPRHRRQDADLRRPFPVPRRGHVRARRRRLRLHPGRSSLSVSILSILRRRMSCSIEATSADWAIVASLVLAAAAGSSIGARRRQYGDERRHSISLRCGPRSKREDYKGALASSAISPKTTRTPTFTICSASLLRKTGDYTTSLSYYTKALDLQPDHKAAREYLGELSRRDRPYGQGEGTACRAREALSRGLRRTRGSRKGDRG